MAAAKVAGSFVLYLHAGVCVSVSTLIDFLEENNNNIYIIIFNQAYSLSKGVRQKLGDHI